MHTQHHIILFTSKLLSRALLILVTRRMESYPKSWFSWLSVTSLEVKQWNVIFWLIFRVHTRKSDFGYDHDPSLIFYVQTQRVYAFVNVQCMLVISRWWWVLPRKLVLGQKCNNHLQTTSFLPALISHEWTNVWSEKKWRAEIIF